MRRKWLRSTACALAAAALCGCSALGGGQANPKAASPPPEGPPPDLSAITPDLEMMRMLPAGDPARQAEIFQSTKDAAALFPTTSNKLKYALALATPGHGGSDPVAAQRQLSELLATPETLLPVERLLAMVELQNVDQRLVLIEENKQLREEAPRESRDKLVAINRRLSAESDENARLRKALDEAINDREANGSHTP
ncbi:MAG: hypothetical protein ABSH33_09590 [Steroidobacteraceae bacterium]